MPVATPLFPALCGGRGLSQAKSRGAAPPNLVVSWLPVTGCGQLLLGLRGLHGADLRHELDESRATLADF